MQLKKDLCIAGMGGVLSVAGYQNIDAIGNYLKNDVASAASEGLNGFMKHLFDITPTNDVDLFLCVGTKVAAAAALGFAYYKSKRG